MKKSEYVVLCGLVWPLCFITTSCNGEPEVYFRSVSPDASRNLVVWREPHAPDWSVKVTLTEHSGRPKTIYADNRDRAPTFADAVWSKDSARFLVVVCDGYADTILSSYSPREEKVIEAGELQGALSDKLRQRAEALGAEPPTDPAVVEWFCAECRAQAKWTEGLRGPAARSPPHSK